MKSTIKYLKEWDEPLNEGIVNWLKKAGMIVAMIGALSGCAHPTSAQEVDPMPTNSIVKTIENKTGIELSNSVVDNVVEKLEDGKTKEAEKEVIDFVLKMPEGKGFKSADVNKLVGGESPLLQNRKEMRSAFKSNPYGQNKKEKNDYVGNMTGSGCYFMCLNYIPQYEFDKRLSADQMAEVSKECHSDWDWSDIYKKQYQKVGGLVSHSREKTDPRDAWVNMPNTVANMAYKILENPEGWKDADASWRNATENSGPIKRIGVYKKGEKIPKSGYKYIIVKLPTSSGTHFVLCDKDGNLIYDPYSTRDDSVSNSLRNYLKTGDYIAVYLFDVK